MHICGDIFFLHCQINPSKAEWHKKLYETVNDLDPTEDGEAGEEPHGAANEAELGLQGHLHILLYLVVGGRVKVDMDQLQGGWLKGGGWVECTWLLLIVYIAKTVLIITSTKM